jgi:hypothetical protein
MRWVGHAPIMRQMRNIYKIPRRKSERKRLLGTPSLTCEDDIKMNLNIFGSECMDLIHLTQDSIEI